MVSGRFTKLTPFRFYFGPMRWLNAFLLCLLVTPSAALAEPVDCRLCGEGGTLTGDPADKARPVALEVRTSLDFDRVVLTGPGPVTSCYRKGRARGSDQSDES